MRLPADGGRTENTNGYTQSRRTRLGLAAKFATGKIESKRAEDSKTEPESPRELRLASCWKVGFEPREVECCALWGDKHGHRQQAC